MALEALIDAQLDGQAPLERLPEAELREVELVAQTGGWPAGTRGVIVDAFTDRAMVEISGEGEGLCLVTATYSDLAFLGPNELVDRPAADHRSG